MGRKRILSARELTVSFLDRQLLLERKDMSARDAVQRLVALQAQYSPSPYMALHSRLQSFEVEQLERALRRGAVVKATLMRGTLHLVAGADYPSFAMAWQPQHLVYVRGRHKGRGVDEEAITASLVEFARVARTAEEIKEHVASLAGGTVLESDLLHYARALVPLRHVFPSGGWRHHLKYSVIHRPEDMVPVEPAATGLLVRRYLAAFGPASREDIAHFTYLRYHQLDPAMAEIGAVSKYTDTEGRDLWDLPRAPITREDTPTPVRFLPNWDAALLSHKDRTRILPEQWHKHVVKSINGGLLATYLLDGQVAGLWTTTRKGKAATMKLEPFIPIPPAASAEVEREGMRMLKFVEPDATTHTLT